MQHQMDKKNIETNAQYLQCYLIHKDVISSYDNSKITQFNAYST